MSLLREAFTDHPYQSMAPTLYLIFSYIEFMTISKFSFAYCLFSFLAYQLQE